MVAIPQDVADDLPNHDPEDRPDFEAMPEGHYLVRVKSNTEESPKAGGSGYEMLKLELEVVQPREFKNRVLFDRLSYSPKARWKLRSFFDAVDYDYDSDVDEIQQEQEEFVVMVDQSMIGQGKKKGELGNNVNEYLPADDENMDLVEE